jgi:hypothetical protein
VNRRLIDQATTFPGVKPRLVRIRTGADRFCCLELDQLRCPLVIGAPSLSHFPPPPINGLLADGLELLGEESQCMPVAEAETGHRVELCGVLRSPQARLGLHLPTSPLSVGLADRCGDGCTRQRVKLVDRVWTLESKLEWTLASRTSPVSGPRRYLAFEVLVVARAEVSAPFRRCRPLHPYRPPWRETGSLEIAV